MATFEQNGLMTVIDRAGNKYLMYPITKLECVDGLEEALANAAPAQHGHAAGDIDSGTLGVARGGTGGSTAETARKGIGACAPFAPVTITVNAANWAGAGP